MNRGFTRPILLFMILWLVLDPIGLVANSQQGKPNPNSPGTPEERKAAQQLLIVPDKETGWVRLPVRIIIARGIVMNKQGVAMNSWIEKKDLERHVLTEVNRIWRSAQIEWAIEKIVENQISAEESKSKEEALQQIVQSKRDESGKSDAKRMPLIQSFFNPQHLHPVAQNLHFFPYLGTTSQGNARLGGNIAFVGLWTDKPSRGNRPPQRTLLVEPLPFQIGSLARTCAHELGHNLKLVHPQKGEPTELGRLMGGKQQGYDLTKEEIATARAAAIQRAKAIQAWTRQKSLPSGK